MKIALFIFFLFLQAAEQPTPNENSDVSYFSWDLILNLGLLLLTAIVILGVMIVAGLLVFRARKRRNYE